MNRVPPRARHETEPLLRVEGLRTWFGSEQGEVRAVDAVDFEVHEGETVGLVGESGCGKTVTALSLLGLVPEPGRIVPESSIRLRGEELVGAPPERLRAARGVDVAMVFQEPAAALNPVLTVGEQVAEVLRWRAGMGRRQAWRRAVELLEEVGLPDAPERARAHPHELSGGMRQRAVIAAALAGEPALLVADEPTTALDVTIQAQLLDLLRELTRRRGMALLLVSHDLGVVSEVCDRVLVMYAGEIVEQGPAEAVLRAPSHPYTRGLLESIPRLDGPTERLRSIAGTVPDPSAWPEGCRFAPRCPHAWSRCRAQHPPPLELPAPEPAPSRNGAEGHGASGPEAVERPDGSEADARPMGPGGPGPQASPTETRWARCWLVEEPHRREGPA